MPGGIIFVVIIANHFFRDDYFSANFGADQFALQDLITELLFKHFFRHPRTFELSLEFLRGKPHAVPGGVVGGSKLLIFHCYIGCFRPLVDEASFYQSVESGFPCFGLGIGERLPGRFAGKRGKNPFRFLLNLGEGNDIFIDHRQNLIDYFSSCDGRQEKTKKTEEDGIVEVSSGRSPCTRKFHTCPERKIKTLVKDIIPFYPTCW